MVVLFEFLTLLGVTILYRPLRVTDDSDQNKNDTWHRLWYPFGVQEDHSKTFKLAVKRFLRFISASSGFVEKLQRTESRYMGLRGHIYPPL